ncbi:hypothetical protein QOZ80_5AG0408820 [Eleusine coracana subsp. coracana]|nr:hypothetical protein QOZ80_5AG0408820 [Eleusine coracana subsp. coracana]
MAPPPHLVAVLFLLVVVAAAAAQPPPPHHIRPLVDSLPPPPPPPSRHSHRHHHTPVSPSPPPPGLTHLPPPPPSPQQLPISPSTPVAVPPPVQEETPPPTINHPSSSATPDEDGEPYPFTHNPFFPTAASPPPSSSSSSSSSGGGDGGLPTFPANISNLVTPTNTRASSDSHTGFPVLQALLLSLLSLCLILLSALLSIHLVRRLRTHHHHHRSTSNTPTNDRNNDDDDDQEEGRSLKPPPMPTSSTNPSTEFLYLGTLATPPETSSNNLRPGSPELRPLPPLPRVGPPSGEFASRSSASDPSTVPRAADASSSSLSPSSPSASSPTLASSPVVHLRPPSIPHPRARAPSPPKPRPSPPKNAHAWNPFLPPVHFPPSSSSSSFSSSHQHQGAGLDSDDINNNVPKSRPLHSDKLNPASLHIKDEVIQQYLNKSTAPREVCLLRAPRCHAIGMLVGSLPVSMDQLRGALLEGNAHALGLDTLRMLTQIVLTNEEELKLKYFKDDSLSKLCPVEAFVKAMLDVPFAFKRVDAMLYIASFYLEVNQLRMSYATLEAACQEMRSSRLFHKVLEAVLNFGNFMSINAGSPNSQALEPNTLLKIVDVKGADGKAALLQFVVQEILKPEGCKMNTSALQGDIECRKHGIQVVSKLAAELTNTKKAASIDITRLSRTVSELGVGLGKIHDVLRLNSMVTSVESARRFHNNMSTFLRQAEEEILKIQSQESTCLSSVRDMAEYFHGDSASDEARMFRIFASVREFLAMLDRICKEAGVMDSHCVGANWMPATPMGMTTP